MIKPINFEIYLSSVGKTESYHVTSFSNVATLEELVHDLRSELRGDLPLFLQDDQNWHLHTMLQRRCPKASYALRLSDTPGQAGLVDGDNLKLREAYDTKTLIPFYLHGDAAWSDTAQAGLPNNVIPDGLNSEEYIRLALGELHRLGYVSDLVVLAICRWGEVDSLQMLFSDVANDFLEPSLACPGVWPGLCEEHVRIEVLWRKFRNKHQRIQKRDS